MSEWGEGGGGSFVPKLFNYRTHHEFGIITKYSAPTVTTPNRIHLSCDDSLGECFWHHRSTHNHANRGLFWARVEQVCLQILETNPKQHRMLFRYENSTYWYNAVFVAAVVGQFLHCETWWKHYNKQKIEKLHSSLNSKLGQLESKSLMKLIVKFCNCNSKTCNISATERRYAEKINITKLKKSIAIRTFNFSELIL